MAGLQTGTDYKYRGGQSKSKLILMKPYLSAVTWLLTTAGISAVLVAAGFLIDYAFQKRLGYQVHYFGSVELYLTITGEFVADTLRIAVGWLAENILSFCLGATIIIFVPILLRPRVQAHLWVRTGLFYFLLLVSGVKIILLDLPTFYLNDLLVKEVTQFVSISKPAFLASQISSLWHQQVCPRTKAKPEGLYEKSLEKAGFKCISNADYEVSSRNYFVLNLLVTTLCLLGGIWLTVVSKNSRSYKWEGDAPVETSSETHQTSLMVFVTLSILFLLHSYAKTQRSTAFDEVIARVNHGKRGLIPEHGFLISWTDREAVLFHKAEDQIWVVPRTKIALLKVEKKGDVLEHFYKKSLGRDTVKSRS